MPDLLLLIKNWWKQILAVVVLSLLAVGLITFLKPRQYLAVATALPASSLATDKARIFNENIQALYSALGSPDDLDRMIGTARLDTVFLAVTDQFNLYDHYKLKDTGEIARTRAALLLKKNSRVMKSEYGELKVKVWDTDKNLAPQLANAVMETLQSIHTDLQNAGNVETLNGLLAAQKKLKAGLLPGNDSLNGAPINKVPESDLTISKKIVEDQLQQYEKLINEYRLMADSKAPALVIVEKAKPALYPDRPRRVQIMVAAALLSFLFALLAALVMEGRKNPVV